MYCRLFSYLCGILYSFFFKCENDENLTVLIRFIRFFSIERRFVVFLVYNYVITAILDEVYKRFSLFAFLISYNMAKFSLTLFFG